jgi:hypothetical protein
LDVVELAQCIHDGIEGNLFLSVRYLERAPASPNETVGASKTALRHGSRTSCSLSPTDNDEN